MYAFTAKKPGSVREITDIGIIVDYDDGSTEGYKLGRRFGNAQGLTVAHTLVTELQVGDKLVIGNVIIYNNSFFEPDFFDARRVVWKNSMNVKTVLWESAQTLEDSSVISRRISDQLTSMVTKVKTVVISFDQAVSQLVKVGDRVVGDSVLCIIEDAVTANNQLFDTQSIETLKSISAQTPRAHVKGVVERVEVFYHGDVQDMSDSLAALIKETDKELKRQALATAKPVMTGSVDGGFRVDSNPLSLDTLALKIYITSEVGAGVGDKGVFANQLKTCFGEVLEQELKTESGEIVDAIFGYKSIEARIVESPAVIGTTSTLLGVIGKRASEIYRGTRS